MHTGIGREDSEVNNAGGNVGRGLGGGTDGAGVCLKHALVYVRPL